MSRDTKEGIYYESPYVEMDDIERRAVTVEVVRKLPYLSMIRDEQNLIDNALDYIDFILSSDESRWYEILSSMRDEIAQRYGKSISGISPSLYISNLLWEAIYVFSYYLCYTDKNWTTHVLPRMIELEPQKRIREEMTQAANLVDDYMYQRYQFGVAINAYEDESADETTAFHIADSRKTDVMKILNYMYDLGMFCQSNGLALSRCKKQFMIAIGKFFNSDFENYAQAINRAAQEEHFMDVFHDLLDNAQQKYLGE